MDYASKGVAGTGLGLGIAGTALGVLNSGGGNLLSGLLGGNNSAIPAAALGLMAASAGEHSCSDNTSVNRYELNQLQTIANKDMEIAYWRGQDETNRKISDAYAKLESRINDVSAEVRANKDEQVAINMQQAVYNGTNTATIQCIQNQVDALQGVLGSLTKTVIPNSSVCPGWGAVTVKPETEETTTT